MAKLNTDLNEIWKELKLPGNNEPDSEILGPRFVHNLNGMKVPEQPQALNSYIVFSFFDKNETYFEYEKYLKSEDFKDKFREKLLKDQKLNKEGKKLPTNWQNILTSNKKIFFIVFLNFIHSFILQKVETSKHQFLFLKLKSRIHIQF